MLGYTFLSIVYNNIEVYVENLSISGSVMGILLKLNEVSVAISSFVSTLCQSSWVDPALQNLVMSHLLPNMHYIYCRFCAWLVHSVSYSLCMRPLNTCSATMMRRNNIPKTAIETLQLWLSLVLVTVPKQLSYLHKRRRVWTAH